ncbi:hypothetical protein MJI47_28875, partial [Salmonella enterica subsp. enterica serovar Kentucky]|nr:hypothetical protein [Salmonella enterica subsp. enterica serovar Kentucky]
MNVRINPTRTNVTLAAQVNVGANAHIGPFCIVGPQVEIGEGTVLKSHVVVNGQTKIGRDNE